MVEKSKNKKIFVFFAITLILSAGVLAFFTFNYDKEVNYQVVGSKGDLLVLVDLTDQIFNVSESLSSPQNLTIVNQNGATQMNFTEILNVTNLDPGNCTITGDITFELFKVNIGLIPNSTTFTMNAGINNFVYNITAVNNRVCPQNITSTLMFIEV